MKDIMNKKVSVVMCTYNGAKFLQEQLDSILNQTYPIFELVIQDDISTDETVDIVKDYQKKYNHIHLYVNKQRLGAHPNFLNALEKVSGDYIAISDQDDIWDLTKIEKQMACMKDCVLSFSLGKSFGDGVVVDPECRVPNVNALRLLFYPVIPGHAMLFQKIVFEKIPEQLYKQHAYDSLLAFSAVLFGGVAICPEVLNYHRRHVNAFSYSKPKNYNKSFFNVLRYVVDGVWNYFSKREKIQSHFFSMYNLIMLFNPDKSDELEDAILFSKNMSRGSLLKASLICYRRRNDIFYAKSEDNILLKFRALLFPLLCSDYY